MAKEIPYFKFYIGDWSNGDITLESFELQGIFINVCAYYWSKDCDVSVENVKKKFRMVSDGIDELIACSCIKVIGDNISISFLNEQYESREVQKAINRNNGSLGGRPRKEKTEEKPNGLFFENQNITNKEKRREEKSKEEKNNNKKNVKKSSVETIVSDGIYPKCMDLYNSFIISRTGVGAKINAGTGAAMNKIIAYLKSQIKNKDNHQEEIPRAFEYLFAHFDKWDKFHQGQLNLNQIESNLVNILNSIRNGKQNTKDVGAAYRKA